MRRYLKMLSWGVLAAFIMAAPAHAFDPPGHRKNKEKSTEYRSHDRERRPSSLYPKDDDRRRTIDQFMSHDRVRSAVESGEILSLGDIRRTVKRQFQGRIIRADLQESRRGRGAGYIYDVRVLRQDGSVLAVEMDAVTGRVLGVQGER